MKKPSDLRIPAPDPYAFKSPLKRKFVRWVDRVGDRLWAEPARPIDWASVRKVAVLRLDHIGDVLMAFPCLAALAEQLPQARVDLYVGPWAGQAAGLLGPGIGVRVFRAPWFDRAGLKGGAWKAVGLLARSLREGGYDAVLDLRGDFRHLLAMKRSGAALRIGQALTGGRFLLTHPALYRAGLHESERNLDLLSQAGLKPQGTAPRLTIGAGDEEAARSLRESLGLSRPFVVLHATCAAPAKQWLEDRWRLLAAGLPKAVGLVVVGAEGEAGDAQRIFRDCGRKVHFAMGLLPLPALAAFLRESSLFIGVDSAPAHLAALAGTPVVSLFSGTNEAGQWGPRGKAVDLLQKKTPCSPCELTMCPLGNDCMRQIQVEEVLEKAGKYLK